MLAWRIGSAVFLAAVIVFLVAYRAGWLEFKSAPAKGGRSAQSPNCPIPAYTQRSVVGAAPKIGADCSVTATDPVSLVFDDPFPGNHVRMTIKGRFDASRISALVFASNEEASDGWVVRHLHDFVDRGVLTLDICRTTACPTDSPGYFPFTNYKGTFPLGSQFTIVVDVDRSTGRGDMIRTWMPTTPSANPGGDMAYTAEGFSFSGTKLGLAVAGATIFAVTIENL